MISAIKTKITILSILTAPYYLCLDIWGIEWKWVANYKDVQMALFIFLVGIECLWSLFVAFFLQKKDKIRYSHRSPFLINMHRQGKV